MPLLSSNMAILSMNSQLPFLQSELQNQIVDFQINFNEAVFKELLALKEDMLSEDPSLDENVKRFASILSLILTNFSSSTDFHVIERAAMSTSLGLLRNFEYLSPRQELIYNWHHNFIFAVLNQFKLSVIRPWFSLSNTQLDPTFIQTAINDLEKYKEILLFDYTSPYCLLPAVKICPYNRRCKSMETIISVFKLKSLPDTFEEFGIYLARRTADIETAKKITINVNEDLSQNTRGVSNQTEVAEQVPITTIQAIQTQQPMQAEVVFNDQNETVTNNFHVIPAVVHDVTAQKQDTLRVPLMAPRLSQNLLSQHNLQTAQAVATPQVCSADNFYSPIGVSRIDPEVVSIKSSLNDVKISHTIHDFNANKRAEVGYPKSICSSIDIPHSTEIISPDSFHRFSRVVNDYHRTKPVQPFCGRADKNQTFCDLKSNVTLVVQLQRWLPIHEFLYLTRFCLTPSLAVRLINTIGAFEENQDSYARAVKQLWYILHKECQSSIALEREFKAEEKITFEKSDTIDTFLERVNDYIRRRSDLGIPLDEVKSKLIIRNGLNVKYPSLKVRSSEWLDKPLFEFVNLVRDHSHDLDDQLPKNDDLLSFYSNNPRSNYNSSKRDNFHSKNKRSYYRKDSRTRRSSTGRNSSRGEISDPVCFRCNGHHETKHCKNSNIHQIENRCQKCGSYNHKEKCRNVVHCVKCKSDSHCTAMCKKSSLKNKSVNKIEKISDDELFSSVACLESCNASFVPVKTTDTTSLIEKYANVRSLVKNLQPTKPTCIVPPSIVKAVIHGSEKSKLISALIDTGSSIDLISSKGLEKLKEIGCKVVTSDKPERILWGGSDITLTFSYVCCYLTLPITNQNKKEVTVKISAYLVDNLSHPLIIGRDTLSLANLSVCYQKSNLDSNLPAELVLSSPPKSVSFCEKCVVTNTSNPVYAKSHVTSFKASVVDDDFPINQDDPESFVSTSDHLTPTCTSDASTDSKTGEHRKRSYKIVNVTLNNSTLSQKDKEDRSHDVSPKRPLAPNEQTVLAIDSRDDPVLSPHNDISESTIREIFTFPEYESTSKLATNYSPLKSDFLDNIVDTCFDLSSTAKVIRNEANIPGQPQSQPFEDKWIDVVSYAGNYELVEIVTQTSWIAVALVRSVDSGQLEFLVDVSEEFVNFVKKSKTKGGQRQAEIHPTLRDWMDHQPENTTIGLKLVQQFVDEKKLVTIHSDSMIMSTNFYLINTSRIRPVFPNLDVNDSTKSFLAKNSFHQKLMSVMITRGRVHQEEVTADITDAYMSIVTSKRLSSVLGLRTRGLGIKLPDGQNSDFLAFTRVPYGWSASPWILETVMSYVIDKFSNSPEVLTSLKNSNIDSVTIRTMNEWILPSCSPFSFEIGSFMDDIRLNKSSFSLEKESLKVECDTDYELLQPLLDFTPKFNLICKLSKIQKLTNDQNSKTLGVLYFDRGEKIKYAHFEKVVLETLPEVSDFTLASCLGFLAKLNPTLPECVPPWTSINKNLLQQLIGLVVANLRSSSSNKISKKSLKLIWSTVDENVAKLVHEFQQILKAPTNLNHFVYRGIDTTKTIIVYCDSSKYALGYIAYQESRIIFFRQFLVKRLAAQVAHINLKESVAISVALIDIVQKFREAKILCPIFGRTTVRRCQYSKGSELMPKVEICSNVLF